MTCDNFLELRDSGFAVDDNNEPITEKIPVTAIVDAIAHTAIDRKSISAEGWGFDDVDQ